MVLPPLVLASASPRRRRLLTQLDLPLDIQPADIDETRVSGAVEERVQALAHRKAEKVAHTRDDGFVLAADTLGSIDGDILGKPVDAAEAIRMLWRLADRAHDVWTGLAVLRVEGGKVTECVCDVVGTRVVFRPLGLRDIQTYVASGESEGKAGAYAIQGAGRRLVDHIEGPYTNVVGLPLTRTLELLRQSGYPVPEVDVARLELLPEPLEA